MNGHRTRIEPVPVPGWTLHWPVCSCGWRGAMVRTRPLAKEQENEHLQHLQAPLFPLEEMS